MSKKKSNPLMGELRQKKTNYPSSLTLKIQIQPKKKSIAAKQISIGPIKDSN